MSGEELSGGRARPRPTFLKRRSDSGHSPPLGSFFGQILLVTATAALLRSGHDYVHTVRDLRRIRYS